MNNCCPNCHTRLEFDRTAGDRASITWCPKCNTAWMPMLHEPRPAEPVTFDAELGKAHTAAIKAQLAATFELTVSIVGADREAS